MTRTCISCKHLFVADAPDSYGKRVVYQRCVDCRTPSGNVKGRVPAGGYRPYQSRLRDGFEFLALSEMDA